MAHSLLPQADGSSPSALSANYLLDRLADDLFLLAEDGSPQELIQAGCAPVLVGMLTHNNPSRQTKAVKIVYELADVEENCDALVRAGVLQPLVHLLHTGANTETAEYAA